MHRLTALLALLAALAVRADLDRIDADGVTETGGDPRYARMLPRTGTNGLLSATLLPPVADWASQPIARLYYASAGAPTQGNGSPQYPFNTLAYAIANMAPQSALILAPGDYSGSMRLQSGQAVTLLGMGGQARVTSLTVAVEGSSADTMLDLCGLQVGTLTVNGGRVDIRLAATAVQSLAGSASGATVTRTDMGSRIGASTLTHVDRYTGFVDVPDKIVSGDGLRKVTTTGSRAVFVNGSTTYTLAHTAEIAAAESRVNASIATLSHTNAATVALVADERAARAAADNALSNDLARAVSEMAGDVSAVSANWGSQLTAVNSRIAGVSSALSALSAKESGDVSRLDAAVSSTQDGYAAADGLLRADLGSAITNAVTALEGRIPGVVDTRATTIANNRLGATTNAVIDAAVARADANAKSREATITNSVRTLSNQVSAMNGVVSGHTTSIVGLTSRDTELSGRIGTVTSRVTVLSNDLSSVSTAVGGIQTWIGTINSWKSGVDSDISDIKRTVNELIDCVQAIVDAVHPPDAVVPDKLYD